jgi:HPt (histidine-containing phosphotransfer) domain-containing protein
MTEKYLSYLRNADVDVEGVSNRFSGDMDFYEHLLNLFIHDDTMKNIEEDVRCEKWDEAFTEAHALKGLAGNLGFTALFQSISELVIIIRSGRLNELSASLENVKSCYDQIIKVINKNVTDETL